MCFKRGSRLSPQFGGDKPLSRPLLTTHHWAQNTECSIILSTTMSRSLLWSKATTETFCCPSTCPWFSNRFGILEPRDQSLHSPFWSNGSKDSNESIPSFWACPSQQSEEKRWTGTENLSLKIPLWIRSLTRVFRFFRGTPCAPPVVYLKNGKPYVQAPGTALKNHTQLATLTHEV